MNAWSWEKTNCESSGPVEKLPQWLACKRKASRPEHGKRPLLQNSSGGFIVGCFRLCFE